MYFTVHVSLDVMQISFQCMKENMNACKCKRLRLVFGPSTDDCRNISSLLFQTSENPIYKKLSDGKVLAPSYNSVYNFLRGTK